MSRLRTASMVMIALALPVVGCIQSSSETASAPPTVRPTDAATPSRQRSTAEPSAVVSETPDVQPVWTETARFGEDGVYTASSGAAFAKGTYLVTGIRRLPANEVGWSRGEDRLWRSGDDGASWESVPLPAGYEDVRSVSILAAPDDSFLLYGVRYSDQGVAEGVVLGSADGIGWTELNTALPEDLGVGKVVRGGRGYALLAGQTGFAAPSIWYSTDGVSWERVHEFSQATEWVHVSDLDAGEDGFVAFGVRTHRDENVWTRFSFASGDGRSWFETPAPFGDEPHDFKPDVFVSSFGPDWVASIADRDGRDHIWRSPDGLSWAEISAFRGVSPWPVFAEANGALYVGEAPIAEPTVVAAPTIWRSTDAVTWQRLTLDPAGAIGALIAGPDRLVLAGTVKAGQFTDAVIWVASR